MLEVEHVPGFESGAHRNFSRIKYMGKEGLGFRRLQPEYWREIWQKGLDLCHNMFSVDRTAL